ncbi:MAG: helix-turn-helix domain-containing protein [Lachnospiraceae bacterium]|nr:helix-turn-helix domain-containing protein [Lachnospiraceae bacterium]
MSKIDTLKERMQSATRLRRIRENANLTQEQFSEILGISLSAYKKVESGENQVSLSSLRNLRRVMNISTDYILYGDNQNLEDTWCMILNCSEPDKMFLLLRLLVYFTKIKDTAFPLQDNQSNEDKEIMQLLRKLQSNGEG